MKLTVTYQGGTRFNLTSGRHSVVTDQPVEDGGEDAGMSPVELFVGSLAGCVGYFVARFCARHRIPADGLTIDAEWSMAEQPHRVGAVALHLRLPAEVTAEQRERLLKVAHGCTVHQSLAVPPTVEIALETEQRQSVT
ncbi:MAG: OsmC family protein [Nitrospirota bacterium]